MTEQTDMEQTEHVGTEPENVRDVVDEALEIEDGINAYVVPVTDVDVQFLTNVSPGTDAMTLGDAAEVAALNLVRVGLDGYRILYTDRPTGRQWVGERGIFVALPPREGEGPDATAD